MTERSEQELVRRGKLAAVRERQYPFPNDVTVTGTSAAVRAACSPEDSGVDRGAVLTIAGRLLAIRHMGKASFCHLQDRDGRIQIYVRKDDVGEEAYEIFKSFDLGDIVACTGVPFTTKTGEPTLNVSSIRLLVKCLHPLPEKWHGLTDVEIRYRQRYVDLIVNPDVASAFKARAKIISMMRSFFEARGYIEVETPVMATVASGANARPFVTHHNALDLELHLRIALELPLKKLVVGGLERVFEIGRVFRNEGISTEHNPEFTMIEFYQAYATYETLMDLTEELFTSLAREVCGGERVIYGDHEIDFSRPWKRISMLESIHEIGGVPGTFNLQTLDGVHAAAESLGYVDVRSIPDYGLALYELFDRHVESKIVNPTFITHHPKSISPLAYPNHQDPRFVDRFELMVAGMELANAFSELNDAEDQRERFEAQLRARAAGDEEAMGLDEDFVVALEYGMPPTAGEGIGIDRLVMLLTNSQSIRDVILFPTLRPRG